MELPTRRSRATIVTLSRSAGVSASTVSRALKGDERISKAMRSRIAELAREAGYMPNALARTLSSGRASYAMTPSHFEPVPNNIVAAIVGERLY